MAYDLATVTNSGNQLLASVVSDRSSLVIDKIEVSGTQLASSTDLKSMTSISNVVQTLSANGYQKKDSSFIISTVLDNSSVTADYQAWVFGIWAHETGGGSPILMSVITSTSSPDTITKVSGTPVDYNYKFVTTFSNTSSLTIQMNSDTYATNDTVLHNSGDETATGTKTFQEIKISNDKFPSLVQTDGQYITLDGGNSELIPADDAKVVHTADMRKPASDVAGIEEVNAKQDKIGYTPADDSKVVHTADTSNWQKQKITQDDGTPFIKLYGSSADLSKTLQQLSGGFHTIYANSSVTNNPLNGISSVKGFVDIQGTGFGEGTLIGSDSTSQFFQYSVWVTNTGVTYTLLANDSKVAHLSGANNFDTVPTVNNNPLLLASSLPSDLARTSQQTNFTAGLQSNGQDVVTVKTPGVPKLAVNYNVNSKAFDYTLTAPEKDGFSDILQYNLLWKDHSVDDWTTVIVKPDDLTGQLTGVDIPKTYDFKAAAQNAVGSSGYTDVITLGTAVVPGIPSLTVEYNAGKKGFDYTVAAPESDGGSEITGYSLEYQKQGSTDWTKVALNPDSLTGTVTDGIEAGSDYLFRVNAENAVGSSEYFTVSDPLPTVDGNIYGVSWDGSSSGALQRTDAAVGLKAGINGAQNDFDTRGPWGLMDKTVTDSYGNAFVRVPKFYIRKTQNKPLSTWQVSLVKQGDDWYLPNCFYDFDNKKELDYVDVSRYEGSIASGKLQSKTGATPTTNQTIVQLRSSAVANNTDGKKGYHLWDVHTLDALQVLFTIEFATLDSQSIMKGVTDNVLAGAEAAGAADGVKGSSGNVDHSKGYGSMTYRGIENLYGNLAMFTDGLNINNLSLYSCDDATKYASDVFASPYYKLNYSLYSGGSNITGLGFDKDHPSVEAPTSFNNDQYNTYYHDYGYVYSGGNYVVYTGGGWDWLAGLSGLWFWFGSPSSSYAGSDVGSRLLKKAL